MKTHRFIAALATLNLMLLTHAAWADPDACFACHEGKVHQAAYDGSAHRDLNCTACHTKDASAPAPSRDDKTCVAAFVRTECARCHEKEAEQHTTSVHNGKRLPVACEACHADIHAIQTHKGDKAFIAETCAGCHSRQKDYFDSIHGKGVAAGHADAPTCADCHGTHTVAKVDNDGKGRALHTRACLRCHDDEKMMERNKVTPIAGATYFKSFHGKNVSLGYPEHVAGCADCHTAHAVRKADDPLSSVNPAHLVETCGQCHAGANASFIKYIPHAEDGDRARYPALYWSRVAMTTLLVGTFFFFWLHSLLWALRAFVERRSQKTPAPAQTHEKRTYRRFTRTQIAMHLVVIVSFLTLALTGLPLKFSWTGWGRVLMDALGGPDRARLIHHASAVVTFGYFSVALVSSLRFLLNKGPSGIVARLFGPDSLFPNRRDWRDFKAMARWFAFRGPRPTFDRWTYWEKFDFLAVFWGMFAIGASGLMLWFPEASSRLLPGWMFNVATIIHSDEALLATGFIFTVHFFNTHLRPEKFPMDTVIFDGRISEEDMRVERADQWKRYEAEGRTAQFLVTEEPSVAWEIAYRIFGFAAVAIGLSLALAIGYALLSG